MKKFLSALLTGFALFFSIPTVLVLASWNAIPGDRLYSVKSSLEDVALALTANTRIATSFSVNFTDRRFDEAAILLDRKGSTVGYELLVAEAQQTRSMVLNKQDTKNGAELVRKIEEYQADIEVRQAAALAQASTPTTTYVPTPAPVVGLDPTAPPAADVKEKETVFVTTTEEVVIEEEEAETVVENLEDVLDELEEIKIEIEEELPDIQAETPSSYPDNSTGDDETTEPEEETGKKDKKDKERPSRDAP